MTDPDTISAAVLRHIEKEATKADATEGVPTEVSEEITEKHIRKDRDADEWETDEVTAVRQVPRIRGPVDPTGCMM